MRVTKRYPASIKLRALELRRQGFLFSEILEKLAQYKIPKNTLSDWCKKAHMALSEEQKKRINDHRRIALHSSQMRGGVWHSQQRENRLQHAEFDAQDFLQEHKRTTNTDLFFLLGLYLGEGAKGDGKVLFANANPRVIQAFLLLLRKVFPLDEKRLKIQLLLRYDQDKQKTQLFWLTITKIPISQFQKVQSDLRTKNIPTFASYKGVCAICYSDAKIQRFLLALQRQHLDSILSQV